MEPDDSLAIRAVWLHYAGGLTQAAVAKRLGLPTVKTHRLIARAVAEGVVKVSIDGAVVACVELEAALSERFSLDHCVVAPDLAEPGLPLRALGVAGADYLRRAIEGGGHRIIGLGHGRTLAAAVAQLPRLDATGTAFVSLLGGLTRNYAANPYDVMHRLAEKTGAQAYVIPVPFFANTAEDREVLLAQRGVRAVVDLAAQASLKLVGIGTVEREAQLARSGMISADEMAEAAAAGAVAEVLGTFLDAAGRPIETGLTARAIAAPLDGAGGLVAIAGGAEKVAPLRAVLASGRLSGLVTDETTARALASG
ncbi:sugar-binding transcriptional regulator [Amaricoccus sp.]|uniref:sugar-binding transcriptional regulator n=1 Tax=Amaricoccus sp. TaxID=1872485 RepID=UPI001B796766|nr:sugar-binding transcriptional regulator [Amaricoccus sp.]MBP6999994.1 sugar-binding transcriptional regulator [Amaricoccus sp.]